MSVYLLEKILLEIQHNAGKYHQQHYWFQYNTFQIQHQQSIYDNICCFSKHFLMLSQEKFML